MKAWLKVILAAAMVMVVAGAAAAYVGWDLIKPRALGGEFWVKPGATVYAVVEELRQREPISPFAVRLGVKYGHWTRLKAGWYKIEDGQSYRQIFDLFIAGKTLKEKLAVVEGKNIFDVARLMASHKGIIDDGALAILTDPHKASEVLGFEARSFEGYLFPDTYVFDRATAASALIDQMVGAMKSKITDSWRRRATELGMTINEIITLASVIEKETGSIAERKMISSVFHNRLKIGMRLQSDPTTIYGRLALGLDYDGNLTKAHLLERNIYNTYKINGLPAGPICNPGLAAIEAAMWPAESDFLYFVSRNNGSHYFSADYETHQHAVRYYQRGNGRPPVPQPQFADATAND